MMIFKYPYTNLYSLNLDWIIQAIKEMQEIVEPLGTVVNSVNGMTGDVEITKALVTQILGGLVETFNGRSGAVELTAEDVNATLIDIVWTSDPGETVHDLTQTQIDEMYTGGKRILIFVNNLGVSDQVYFLQWYDGHAQPQEYTPTSALAGVVSFNGMTGNVVVTGDNIATSATDTDTIAESLTEKVPVTRTVNGQPLSSNVYLDADDIPTTAISGAPTVETALGNLQNSKVPNARTINGKQLLNNVVLNDEDIPSQVVQGETTVEGVLTDLDSRINDQSQQIGNLGPYNGLDSNSTTAALSAAQGKTLNDRITVLDSQNAKLLGSTRIKVLAPGYVTGSGNYFDFFMPASIDVNKTYSITDIDDATFFDNSGKYSYGFTTGEVVRKDYNGLTIELRFISSQTPNRLLLLDTYLTFNVQ